MTKIIQDHLDAMIVTPRAADLDEMIVMTKAAHLDVMIAKTKAAHLDANIVIIVKTAMLDATIVMNAVEPPAEDVMNDATIAEANQKILDAFKMLINLFSKTGPLPFSPDRLSFFVCSVPSPSPCWYQWQP
jgi:hypothetical protein